MKYKKLTEICTPKQWKTIPQSKMLNSGYPVYGANGIIGYYNQYNHKEPTVLITCRGATCGTLNISKPFSYINGNAMALDNIIKEVDEKYLFYFLQNRKLNDAISGSAQPQITIQGLSNIIIEYPPIEEQRKIAQILDKADEIRQKKKLANDKLDELLKSTFISMFGDPVKNDKNYKVKKLQEVTKFLTDGKHGDCEDEENSGYYFVSAKCINNGKIDLTQARQIKYSDYKEVNNRVKINLGDLLIVNTGATIGKMAIIRDCNIASTITLQKSVAVINMQNDVLNSEYLSHCLLFKSMAKVSAGSAIHNLLLSTMRAYELPIPPIDLQNQFAQIVEKVEAQKQKNEKVIEQMNNLFNSLSQRAFKGEK